MVGGVFFSCSIIWPGSSLDSVAEPGDAPGSALAAKAGKLLVSVSEIVISDNSSASGSALGWTAPPFCCTTWVNSWANNSCPSLLFGLYSPWRKKISCPVVNALAWIALLSSFAWESVCIFTSLKSAPNACSIGSLTLSSIGWPPALARWIEASKLLWKFNLGRLVVTAVILLIQGVEWGMGCTNFGGLLGLIFSGDWRRTRCWFLLVFRTIDFALAWAAKLGLLIRSTTLAATVSASCSCLSPGVLMVSLVCPRGDGGTLPSAERAKLPRLCPRLEVRFIPESELSSPGLSGGVDDDVLALVLSSSIGVSSLFSLICCCTLRGEAIRTFSLGCKGGIFGGRFGAEIAILFKSKP